MDEPDPGIEPQFDCRPVVCEVVIRDRFGPPFVVYEKRWQGPHDDQYLTDWRRVIPAPVFAEGWG